MDPRCRWLPCRGAAVSAVRFRAWTVERDREVIMTPEGAVIAERGSVVAVAVGDRFEDVAALLKRLDELEPPKTIRVYCDPLGLERTTLK